MHDILLTPRDKVKFLIMEEEFNQLWSIHPAKVFTNDNPFFVCRFLKTAIEQVLMAESVQEVTVIGVQLLAQR